MHVALPVGQTSASRAVLESVWWHFLLFFPFFFLSHLNPAKPFNFSNQPFNLVFLWIWLIFFLLLFVLFKIIYKIKIVFQFQPSLIFFQLSKSLFFWLLLFSWFILFFNLIPYYIISFNFYSRFDPYFFDCYFFVFFSFSWFMLFFNSIPRCSILFNCYTKFGPYYFYCYLIWFFFLILDGWEFCFMIFTGLPSIR
jgi:hypothetical protein